MGGKKKFKSKCQREPALQNEMSDMSAILSDPRFAHVAKDPKLRHVPKQQRKIKLDSRFSGVFTDNHFYEISTMDPRGRKGNFSTKEDLRKFYDLSSEEDTSSEEDEEEDVEGSGEVEESDEEPQNTIKEAINKNDTEDEKLKIKSKLKKKLNKESEDEEKSEKVVIPSEVDEVLKDMQYDYARGAEFFSDDSSDDDSSTTDESEDDNDQQEPKEEFEWGELDQDAVWDTEDNEVEETFRLAVCNMDWDRIKAADLMILFSSFCPREGEVKSVIIYPSEYGKERMTKEERYGPCELRNKNDGKNKTDAEREIKNLEKLEKGKLDEDDGSTKKHFEALRRYQRNRLRYYYAVVVCDKISTAVTIYKECDRQPFEGAGVLLDLRYIPDDMPFDDVPHDVCKEVPKSYEVKTFTTTALHDTRPTLTWDETNPDRKKTLVSAMNRAAKGEEVDQEQVQAFLASGSEDESEDELAMIGSDIENSEDEDKIATRIAKFRALINEIDEKESKKNAEKIEFDMEENFEYEENEEKDQTENNNETVGKSGLTPFEKYLEKKKEKKKKKKLKVKQINSGLGSETDDESNIEEKVEDRESEEGGKEITMSDDELPEKMKDIYNDPFFSDELVKSKKFNKEKKKKNINSEHIKDTDENLELLVMNEEEEENKHFNMRDIMKKSSTKAKKNRWKDKKNKLKKIIEMKKDIKEEDNFKVNLSDSRFSAIMTSGDYNIDPSHPHFKRTKAMDNIIKEVQQKRAADSMEDIPEAKKQDIGKKRNKKEDELSMLVKKVKNKTKFTNK